MENETNSNEILLWSRFTLRTSAAGGLRASQARCNRKPAQTEKTTAQQTTTAPVSANAALSARERDRAIGRQDGRTPEEVIAAIDSSGWAVNPLDYGISAMDYERAEAELLFGNFMQRAGGVNTFFHFQGLPNTYGTVRYDIRAVDNWEKWTYTIAGGLGLSPDDTAMYIGFKPEGTKGDVCYEASFDPIPAKAFFSITLYDKDKYLMSDEHNIISSNRKNFIARDDGGFDVVFGGKGCESIAEERGANFGYTPSDGWNGLVRAYRPDVEKMRDYQMSPLTPIV